MRNRMTLTSMSIVIVIIAASSVMVRPGSAQIAALLTGQTTAPAQANTQAAQAKADTCLARPGATAPKGSHWYYRLERGGRRCWYLGAAGQGVRAERTARTKRAVAAAAPKPEPAPAPAELRDDEDMRTETPAAAAPAEMGAAAPTASVATATEFSAVWPPVTGANSASNREATPAAEQDSGNEVAPTAETEAADTPAALPVTTANDQPAAQRPEPAAPGLMHVLIFLSAIGAFVIIAIRAVYKLATARRRHHDRRAAPRPAGPVIRRRAPERPAPEPSIEAMSEPTIARLREIAKRWETPTRVPRMPAFEMETDYAVEGAAEGAALRRRQQRVA